YNPIINNLSENEILNQIEGIIYLISFLETFKIQVNINFDDALYTIKKILKSNVNYNDFIENSITNINFDLENFINDLINNTFIDRIKNYRNKKYFFIDLFLLNNVLDEKFYIPDVVQKQQNYLYKIIENYTKLKEQI
ncbi:MAG TPA: hypothetical protein PK189_06335, partial [bacterium]|nr:hypothetical protein [bacterium]